VELNGGKLDSEGSEVIAMAKYSLTDVSCEVVKDGICCTVHFVEKK
jgi:hypothetical protein